MTPKPTPTTSAEGERPVDLDGLEALAKAATPGPWRAGNFETDNIFCASGASMGPERVLARMNHHFGTFSRDAAFIAAANPSTVQALIQEAREYRRLKGALEFLRLYTTLKAASDPRVLRDPVAYAAELGWTEDQGRTL